MDNLLEAIIRLHFGSVGDALRWLFAALLPPLLAMAWLSRYVAPRTLPPWPRRLVWVGCAFGLAAVWIRQGLPAARRILSVSFGV